MSLSATICDALPFPCVDPSHQPPPLAIPSAPPTPPLTPPPHLYFRKCLSLPSIRVMPRSNSLGWYSEVTASTALQQQQHHHHQSSQHTGMGP
jgi:hypothetical protein